MSLSVLPHWYFLSFSLCVESRESEDSQMPLRKRVCAYVYKGDSRIVGCEWILSASDGCGGDQCPRTNNDTMVEKAVQFVTYHQSTFPVSVLQASIYASLCIKPFKFVALKRLKKIGYKLVMYTCVGVNRTL